MLPHYSCTVTFDCSDPDEFEQGIAAAAEAIGAGELIVMPTDTVYGLAADAFAPAAVQKLLDAKGRGRDMPPPVLVSATSTIHALANDVPAWVMRMLDELWPGPLTIVCHQQPSLTWDLGDSRGTVAVRMPDDERALTLLRHTGPLAVSSANTTGGQAAENAEDAHEMLTGAVSVYLDGGRTAGPTPSTIVDITAATPRVLRDGGISLETLHRFNNTIEA